MAASTTGLMFSLRGSQGIKTLTEAAQHDFVPDFQGETSNRCRVAKFSPDGSKFAWCNQVSVTVVSVPGYQTLLQLPLPSTIDLSFSPKANYVATWEQYAVKGGEGSDNLAVWNIASGQKVFSAVHRKHDTWAPQWSGDEGLMSRQANNEVLFYADGNFERWAEKLHVQKLGDYSLSPSADPAHVAIFIPGSKGAPSVARIFKYPNFGPQALVANKSFFKADSVTLTWNPNGTAVIVLVSSDTSDKSYYGEQGLHYIDVKGGSCLIPRDKNGPVYHVEWSPKSDVFVVVFGFMPAKVCLFSLKCEPIFDFGTGPRNVAYFNPLGNLLCIAGFGNLRGHVEFWDVAGRKVVSKCQAEDATHAQWGPDGQHVLTATTAPRLRVSNGCKVWHYSGVLLWQQATPEGQELWDARWRPAAPGAYPPFAISHSKVQTRVEQPKENMPAYRPPGFRDQPESAAAADGPKSKNKKKREARKAKQQDEEGGGGEPVSPPPAAAAGASSGDQEKDKKMRNLRKKLQAVEKLKADQAAGKTLELNQLEKLKTEDGLRSQLEDLQLS